MIALSAGAWTATLRPEVGGAVASLRCEGVPILRDMAEGARHPLDSACFPMVPYCNRIAGGQFAWGGRDVRLAPNLAPQRHPLHGTGWLRPWRTIRHDRATALLEDEYDGLGEWPWPYRAHQFVTLDEVGCTIRLMVENRAVQPAPMGLGLHPYFRRSADSTLQFSAQAMMGINDEFLPDGSEAPVASLADFPAGASLPEVLVDHCFAGWGGAAQIADNLGTITVRGFGAPHCHVFIPPGSTELCVEPVNHLPDAINRGPATMPVVQPGCVAGIALRIEASPA